MIINEKFKSEIDSLTPEDLILAKKMVKILSDDGQEISIEECLKYVKYVKDKNIEKKIIKNFINRSHKYSISPSMHLEMLHSQNYSCAICKKHKDDFDRNLSIDHNHITGKVRGLLCTKCNLVLGLLNDDKNIVENLLKYLENE